VFSRRLALVTWFPEGVLDNDRADRAVEFLETQEKIEGKPFYRYIDMTDIRGFKWDSTISSGSRGAAGATRGRRSNPRSSQCG
jgi:hypothetical protein